MKICKNCGATIYDGEIFCTECGQKISIGDLINAKKLKQRLCILIFSLMKAAAIILVFVFPWYITSPNTGRLLAVESGASLHALLDVYFHGTGSLNATMLSVSTATIITGSLLIAVAAWIISGIIRSLEKNDPIHILAITFTIVFFGMIFVSQIFWPAIMPWLCYGNDFTAAVASCFQLESNPAFNITHWGVLLFLIITIAELIVHSHYTSSEKANKYR